MSAVSEAKDAIAALAAALARLENDTHELADAVARFDHETVLALSLRNERTTEQAQLLEEVCADAIAKAHTAPGGGSALNDDINGLIADARRIGLLRARTTILIDKARSFAAAHQQALLPPTSAQAYGRPGARAFGGDRFAGRVGTLRTAG